MTEQCFKLNYNFQCTHSLMLKNHLFFFFLLLKDKSWNVEICPLCSPIVTTSRNSSGQLKNCNRDSIGCGKLLPLLSLGKERTSLACAFNKSGGKSSLHWVGMLVLLQRSVKWHFVYDTAVLKDGLVHLKSGRAPDSDQIPISGASLKQN